MTDQEFISEIEKRSGKSFAKGDFGFIMGRITPFTEHQGFQSANHHEHFIVWRRITPTDKDDSESVNVYKDTQENYVEFISNFLKKTE